MIRPDTNFAPSICVMRVEKCQFPKSPRKAISMKRNRRRIKIYILIYPFFSSTKGKDPKNSRGAKRTPAFKAGNSLQQKGRGL